MEGGDAALQVARKHAEHGTTALLATTMTAPMEDLRASLAPVGALGAPGAARVLGMHLEGPYINSGKLGAQPTCAAGVAGRTAGAHALAPIRLLTLAPEVPGNLDAIPRLVAAGFRVQIGHTAGHLRGRRAGAGARRARLHAPVQRHDAAAPPPARHGGRGAGARAPPRSFPTCCTCIPARSAPRMRSIPPLLRHRFHRRHRHARRRIPPGPPARHQVPGRRAAGRRHAGRLHADHGPRCATWWTWSACRWTTPRAGCPPTPPISWSWPTAAAWPRRLGRRGGAGPRPAQEVLIEGGSSMSRMLDEARKRPRPSPASCRGPRPLARLRRALARQPPTRC